MSLGNNSYPSSAAAAAPLVRRSMSLRKTTSGKANQLLTELRTRKSADAISENGQIRSSPNQMPIFAQRSSNILLPQSPDDSKTIEQVAEEEEGELRCSSSSREGARQRRNESSGTALKREQQNRDAQKYVYHYVRSFISYKLLRIIIMEHYYVITMDFVPQESAH